MISPCFESYHYYSIPKWYRDLFSGINYETKRCCCFKDVRVLVTFDATLIQNHCYEIYLSHTKCNIALIYLYATFYTGVLISQCFVPIIWKEKVDYQFTLLEKQNWVTILHSFVQGIYLLNAYNVYGSARFNFDMLPVVEKNIISVHLFRNRWLFLSEWCQLMTFVILLLS